MQADIAPDFVQKVKDFIAYLRPTLKEYHEVFTGNIIAQERMKGVGVLSREAAISFGATGGTGRASGWACDVRKRMPYSYPCARRFLLCCGGRQPWRVRRLFGKSWR